MKFSFNIHVVSRVRVALALLASTLSVAQPSPLARKPFTRDTATALIANARKVVTPNGIERLEKVRISGIEQWVSIRGDAKRGALVGLSMTEEPEKFLISLVKYALPFRNEPAMPRRINKQILPLCHKEDV